MATVKPFLHKSPNKQNLYPLAIRVTQGNSSFYVYLGDRIPLDTWDSKKNEVNEKYKAFQKPDGAEKESYKRLNAKLKAEYLRILNKVLALESNGQNPSIEKIKNDLLPPARSKSKTSFFAFADEYFSTMYKGGSYNRWTAERPAVNHFKRFLKGKDIVFADITLKILEDFKSYLKRLKINEDETISERTIINQLIILRTIYNRAIKNHLVDPALSPFRQGGLRLKRPKSTKKGLQVDQIKQLEAAKFIDPYFHHARNLFLFSFYTGGTRAGDVLTLQWKDIDRDRLSYVMAKTNEAGSIKLPQKALALLKEYQKQRINSKEDTEYIFPELKGYPQKSDSIALQKLIHNKIAQVDTALKKIGTQLEFKPKLTMHIARHSFATISGGKIPIQILQQLYRHSDINVTVEYMKAFVTDGTDKALEKVLDY